MEELAIRLRLEGGEGVRNQLDSLGAGFDTLIQLVGVLTAAVAGFMALSFADELLSIEKRLKSLTGSAEEASKILSDTINIAKRSKFETTDVAEFATLLRSAGVSGAELNRQVKALLDLTAGLGIRREDFANFMFNLLQIKSGAAGLQDIKQMFRAAPGIGRLIGQQLGAGRAMTVDELAALMRGEGGERFFQRLIEAGESLSGAAEDLTPLESLANLMESIKIAFLPATKRIGFLLKVFAEGLTRVINILGMLNEKTQGWFTTLGFVGFFYVVLYSLFFLFRAIFRYLKLWYQAAMHSPSPGIGSIALWLGIIGKALRAVAINFLWFLVNLDLRTVLLKSLRQLRAWWLWIRAGIATGLVQPQLLALLNWLKKPMIPILILSILSSFLPRSIADAIQAALTGATVGGLIGSLIPAIGNVAGAIIGGVLGLLYYLIWGRDGDSAASRTAQNTARMTRILEDIRVQLVGGGPGASAFRTRFESEMAVRKALAGEPI